MSTPHVVCVKEDVRDLCSESDLEALFRMERGSTGFRAGHTCLASDRPGHKHVHLVGSVRGSTHTLSQLNKTHKLLHAHPTSYFTSAFTLKVATAAA